MSWALASFLILGAVLLAGFAWYERSRPTSQVIALVAALAALAIAGRIAFAAFPNVKPTTDIVVFAGYALGPAPGFAVGALTALVSNLWFGQGPWTPWQMAGWGMCGLLGAALGLGRWRPNRFVLAAVCGLAGIAYGALLNFSLMATYGGEISLQRFLALQSRAVPFDLAHAIGNVALALVAGPAMVRMLVRFRERFEWRRPAAAVSLLVVALLALLAALPAPAQAAETGVTVSWLRTVQNADGGWGPSVGDDSSAETTGWVVLGLEAAGHNPLDVSKSGRTPVDFLRRDVDTLDSSGDLARTILALEGAGVDPRSFGGRNLVEALLNRRRSNGSYEGWPGSTAFAVMALRAAGATGSLGATMSWLGKVQNGDGGWGDIPGSVSTADGTAAVMQAMPGSKLAQEGLTYLRRHQRRTGGFVTGGNGAVNAQSTAWGVQGMLAVGADPASIRTGGNSALDYLDARLAADGHYSYSAESDQTPVWVTGQALAAAAGHPFPIPFVAREPEPKASAGGVPSTPGTVAPPAAETAPYTPAPTLPEGFAPGGGASPPGGTAPPLSPPSTGGTGPIPGTPETLPEGAEPEPAAAPPFEADENPPPKPWAPLGIGLGTGGLALGGVLFLGRRFGW
jgi:hypothetical protein